MFSVHNLLSPQVDAVFLSFFSLFFCSYGKNARKNRENVFLSFSFYLFLPFLKCWWWRKHRSSNLFYLSLSLSLSLVVFLPKGIDLSTAYNNPMVFDLSSGLILPPLSLITHWHTGWWWRCWICHVMIGWVLYSFHFIWEPETLRGLFCSNDITAAANNNSAAPGVTQKMCRPYFFKILTHRHRHTHTQTIHDLSFWCNNNTSGQAGHSRWELREALRPFCYLSWDSSWL